MIILAELFVTLVRFCAFALSIIAIAQYFLGAPMADWLFSAIVSIMLRSGLLVYWVRAIGLREGKE
jgi:hypothetical protein